MTNEHPAYPLLPMYSLHPLPDSTDTIDRLYINKQMGDACEMVVAAELTLPEFLH
jgi:hypothetical protein